MSSILPSPTSRPFNINEEWSSSTPSDAPSNASSDTLSLASPVSSEDFESQSELRSRMESVISSRPSLNSPVQPSTSSLQNRVDTSSPSSTVLQGPSSLERTGGRDWKHYDRPSFTPPEERPIAAPSASSSIRPSPSLLPGPSSLERTGGKDWKHYHRPFTPPEERPIAAPSASSSIKPSPSLLQGPSSLERTGGKDWKHYHRPFTPAKERPVESTSIEGKNSSLLTNIDEILLPPPMQVTRSGGINHQGYSHLCSTTLTPPKSLKRSNRDNYESSLSSTEMEPPRLRRTNVNDYIKLQPTDFDLSIAPK